MEVHVSVSADCHIVPRRKSSVSNFHLQVQHHKFPFTCCSIQRLEFPFTNYVPVQRLKFPFTNTSVSNFHLQNKNVRSNFHLQNTKVRSSVSNFHLQILRFPFTALSSVSISIYKLQSFRQRLKFPLTNTSVSNFHLQNKDA